MQMCKVGIGVHVWLTAVPLPNHIRCFLVVYIVSEPAGVYLVYTIMGELNVESIMVQIMGLWAYAASLRALYATSIGQNAMCVMA